jgi:hypothetical protein
MIRCADAAPPVKEGEDVSMNLRRQAAIVYAAVSCGAIAFQIALAFGAPWGAYAMGGVHPGRFPPFLRATAIGQALVLLLFALIVVSRAGIGRLRVSRWHARVVVCFTAVSAILNVMTPSAGERMIWAPTTVVLFMCSLIVAAGGNGPTARR